ncbi:hypothetical protein BN132_296 [Cronobacter turicensis 564]|nr:hypothetical protein BN132_296 [Cronobacter turicensis 564]
MPADTPARRAICAMVASLIPTSLMVLNVASINCLRRIGCIPTFGMTPDSASPSVSDYLNFF